MNDALYSLLEAIGLCVSVALLAERAVAALFEYPRLALALLGPRNSARDLINVALPGVQHTANLAGACLACHLFPLHLLATTTLGHVPVSVDTAVTSFFIAGVATLFRRLFDNASIQPDVRGSAVAVPRGSLTFDPPADTARGAIAPQFRLSRLKIGAADAG
jgi:hypothetical protein